MNEQPEMIIDIDQEKAYGEYANLAVINHSTTEFFIDFVQSAPSTPKAKHKARIVLTPPHAKRLFHALKDNIEKFEATNGKIPPENLP